LPPKSSKASKKQQSSTSEKQLPPSSSETSRNYTSFKMKIAFLALLVPLIGFVVGKELQVPFLNSSGWTIHQIPPENRIYWMQQAMQALYNYSGPWYYPLCWLADTDCVVRNGPLERLL